MLEIRNLNYQFRKKSIIENFSHQFKPGIYGLLGANGAGKTTLMRCMVGIYTPKSNTIFYNEQPVRNNRNFFKDISYLPQKFGLFKDLTVKEMMLMMASLKDVDIKANPSIVEDCVATVNLSKKLNDKVKTLSGGMIRRLGIAQTLLNDPKIIIFDEPTAGLDIEERLRFKNIMSKIGKDRIIIISTHIASDIEALCDEVLVLKDKRIAFTGTCQEIAEQAKGKTFILPQTDLFDMKDDYHIQNHFEKDGTSFARIVTNTLLGEYHAKPVDPTIEDGYICLLRDI